MTIRDATTGDLKWKSENWCAEVTLSCRVVSAASPLRVCCACVFGQGHGVHRGARRCAPHCTCNTNDCLLVHPSLCAARMPKDVLECDAVSREMEFSSREAMADLNLKQRVLLMGNQIEGAPRAWRLAHPTPRAARSPCRAWCLPCSVDLQVWVCDSGVNQLVAANHRSRQRPHAARRSAQRQPDHRVVVLRRRRVGVPKHRAGVLRVAHRHVSVCVSVCVCLCAIQ